MYLYTIEQNFMKKILYLGVDFKQNVDFLPSSYAVTIKINFFAK